LDIPLSTFGMNGFAINRRHKHRGGIYRRPMAAG
jgi:hypothetical protein